MVTVHIPLWKIEVEDGFSNKTSLKAWPIILGLFKKSLTGCRRYSSLIGSHSCGRCLWIMRSYIFLNFLSCTEQSLYIYSAKHFYQLRNVIYSQFLWITLCVNRLNMRLTGVFIAASSICINFIQYKFIL